MSGTPLVSVMMLSYEHAAYLPAAIESVLGQTLGNLELVVVDDGSTDSSLEIARRFARSDPRVRVLTHPGGAHRGLGPSVTLARAALRGRFVLGLPSDDVLHPDTLEREVAYLGAHPNVGYVYGYAHLIDRDGRRIPDVRTYGIDLTAGGKTLERLVQRNSIPAMTGMWRRECLDQAGAWNETLVYSDWEFHVRCAAHWDFGFIPRALAQHRRHGRNISLAASPATNRQRALEVTAALRKRAPEMGGRLAAPRIRALLELQMGYLRFIDGDGEGDGEPERHIRAAFAHDPSLARDGRWLGDWLWSRPLDLLNVGRGPEFVRWVGATMLPVVQPSARPALRREVASAHAGANAIRTAQEGRWVRAHGAALAAGARSPRRLCDRSLAAVLLDSIGGGVAARAVRRVKRRALPHR
jgi:hypothetical protein